MEGLDKLDATDKPYHVEVWDLSPLAYGWSSKWFNREFPYNEA
nr:hypothetical protein [Vibrio parahaemolyticus]